MVDYFSSLKPLIQLHLTSLSSYVKVKSKRLNIRKNIVNFSYIPCWLFQKRGCIVATCKVLLQKQLILTLSNYLLTLKRSFKKTWINKSAGAEKNKYNRNIPTNKQQSLKEKRGKITSQKDHLEAKLFVHSLEKSRWNLLPAKVGNREEILVMWMVVPVKTPVIIYQRGRGRGRGYFGCVMLKST